MWTKLSILGCLLLTVVVLHTALRIEYLNERSGMYLPRLPNDTNAQWRVAELDRVLAYVDSQMAVRRINEFAVANPHQPHPTLASLTGAPYTKEEQTWLDRAVRDHTAHTKLRWWVLNFGAAQYFIAPLLFVWAIGNFLFITKPAFRAASFMCGLAAFAAIFLMIFRGY